MSRGTLHLPTRNLMLDMPGAQALLGQHTWVPLVILWDRVLLAME
jgi:hypothetical protein